jgi:hypothetical protein
VAQKPDDIEVLEYYAHELFMQSCNSFVCDSDMLSKAVNLWKQILQKDPNNQDALYSLMEVAIINGIFDLRQQHLGICFEL